MLVQKQFLQELKGHFKLNIYEVKIWTALLSRGIASAAELADISGVPRSRCYDVLESLEKKGFIVMKIGKPIKYIAVKPEIIVERVKKELEQKAQKKSEYIEKIKETDIFKELELLHSTGVKHFNVDEISNSIKGRDNINRFMKKMVEGAKDKVTIVADVEGFKRKAKILKSTLHALPKNVKMNFYCDPCEAAEKKLPQHARLNEYKSNSRFIIVDDEELFFMNSAEEAKPDFESGVWIKSRFFVSALSKMFENSLE